MGTLNKMVGKFKSFFHQSKNTYKDSKDSFKRTMEDAQAQALETSSDKEGPVSKEKRKAKKGNRFIRQGAKYYFKPPWWKRFYGVKTRAEVGLLNKHMVGHFGSFSPVKKAGE